MEIPHIPVLLEQVLETFNMPLMQKGGVVIDCTLGFGGHSEALLQTYPKLRIVGIDRDCNALGFAKERLKGFGNRFSSHLGSYSAVVAELLKDYSAQ